MAYVYFNSNPENKLVGDFFNVSRAINAQVWRGCCETISVRNTSTQPILVQNANIILSRPDLAVTY